MICCSGFFVKPIYDSCIILWSWRNLSNLKLRTLLRDRPFNLKGGGGLWFFVSFRNYLSDNTRVRILIFFQNFTLGYMTKTLNQIIFFFLHRNQNIFFSNIGNQNIFLEKKHTPPPPLQVKWSFPKYFTNCTSYGYSPVIIWIRWIIAFMYCCYVSICLRIWINSWWKAEINFFL